MARCTAVSVVRSELLMTTPVDAATHSADRHQPTRNTWRTVGAAAFVSKGRRPSPSLTKRGK